MKTPASATTMQKLGLASYDMSVSLTLAHRAFQELLKTCLGHHELTIPQWTLLGRLYVVGAIRPVSVAKLLGVKPPYLARLINMLEAEALINIDDFPDDGRGKSIYLTTKGKALVEQVEVKLTDCLNEQLGELKETDLKTYFMLNQYIAEHVRHH